jgi:hypothetical protein
MTAYISIGAQCTTATLFDKMNCKKDSLPFDWMFSTPEFVYTMLKYLLLEKKEIKEIVDEHFFLFDAREKWFECSPAHFTNMINKDDATVIVNTKYNVVFPHDNISDREKYIRRFERLKKLILDESIFVYFVYVSVPRKNYFAINEVDPTQDLYEYIEKINIMLKDIRTNYKILVFDIDIDKYLTEKNSDIECYQIESKYRWQELLPELVEKFNLVSCEPRF